MTISDPNPLPWRRIVWWTAAPIGSLLLLGLFTAIAVSRVPMRGAQVFGALANKIKGNPGATTVVVFAALALLWIGIGVLAAIQEWLATRRRTP